MSLVTPTPVPAAGRPIPSLTSLGTWPADMAEMHRWMREDLAPGAQLLAAQALENAQWAQTQADLAAGLAQFKGPWAGLSGALNMPASVSHAGKLWVLTANLANVATATPGVSGSWVEFRADAFGVAYGASNVGTTLDTLVAAVANAVLRTGLNGAVLIPKGTAAQRPVLGSEYGALRWNTETESLEVYSQSGVLPWAAVGQRREFAELDLSSGTAFSSSFSLVTSPWVREVRMDFRDVEMTASSSILLQFYDGSSWAPPVSLFDSASASFTASSTAYEEATTGFIVRVGTAARKVNGRLVMSRPSTNNLTAWTQSHQVKSGPTITSGGGVLKPTTNPMQGFRLAALAGNFVNTGKCFLTLLG